MKKGDEKIPTATHSHRYEDACKSSCPGFPRDRGPMIHNYPNRSEAILLNKLLEKRGESKMWNWTQEDRENAMLYGICTECGQPRIPVYSNRNGVLFVGVRCSHNQDHDYKQEAEEKENAGEMCSARCTEQATTSVIVNGERKPVCLRHYNIWESPIVGHTAVEKMKKRGKRTSRCYPYEVVEKNRVADGKSYYMSATHEPSRAEHDAETRNEGKGPWCPACAPERYTYWNARHRKDVPLAIKE